jgi:hypothetical protein
LDITFQDRKTSMVRGLGSRSSSPGVASQSLHSLCENFTIHRLPAGTSQLGLNFNSQFLCSIHGSQTSQSIIEQSFYSRLPRLITAQSKLQAARKMSDLAGVFSGTARIVAPV